jgi:predicted nucleic acid-binding protein
MLEPTRVVVVNTTPIIALALIEQLDLLPRLYGRVVIPPAVQTEVLQGGAQGIGVTEIQNANWIRVIALTDPRRADSLPDLDRGEAQVIALAQELRADLVVIDERLARKYARRLKLKLTGTLGVLLRAKQVGFVQAIKPLVEQLVQGGIRLGEDVIAEALQLAKEQ